MIQSRRHPEAIVQALNQYSFVITAAAVIIILAVLLARRGLQRTDLLAVGSLVLGFTFAYFLLQPGESTLGDAEAVRGQIGVGMPVLLELQSPY